LPAALRDGTLLKLKMITLYHCGEEYYADEGHVGRQIRCRKCGHLLTIGAPGPLSPTPSRRPVPAQPWTKETEVFKKGRARRRTPLLKLILAGILLASALGTWVGVARLTRHDNYLGKASVAQTPVPVRLETPSARIPERAAVSLPTGTWVIPPRGVRGHGILTISNGTGLDAVVKLVPAIPPRSAVWMVYIRAHDETVRNGIGTGAYLLRFALGLDWDAATRKFLRGPEFYQAGKQFDFTETESTLDRPGTYDEADITLNEVPFGNLPREPIDELIFNEGEPPN